MAKKEGIRDGERRLYDDDTFDRISIGFGARNFEHHDVGIKEMFRVLRPDGKLVILELSLPSNPVIRWCYKLYFLKILPASVLRFPPPEQFIQILKSVGFDTVEHTPLTLGICRMYVAKKLAL